jgi:ABC-2 type transport system permease protein
MKSYEYVIGYFLSSLPIVVIQIVLFILLAIILGLSISVNLLLALLVGIAVSLLFIAFGILLGSLVGDKSAPGIASVIVQLVAFTSGMWFSADMVGGFFGTLCNLLPFKYCVDILKGIINNYYDNLLLAVIVFLAYLLVITLLSVIFFTKSLKSDKK